MFETFLTYIGHAAERVISKEDLASLGAEAHQLESLAEGEVIKFVQGVATKVDGEIGHFIANHPDLQGEFQHSETPPASAESTTDPATTQAQSQLPGALTPTEQTAATPEPAAAEAPEHPTA